MIITLEWLLKVDYFHNVAIYHNECDGDARGFLEVLQIDGSSLNLATIRSGQWPKLV